MAVPLLLLVFFSLLLLLHTFYDIAPFHPSDISTFFPYSSYPNHKRWLHLILTAKFDNAS